MNRRQSDFHLNPHAIRRRVEEALDPSKMPSKGRQLSPDEIAAIAKQFTPPAQIKREGSRLFPLYHEPRHKRR